MLIWEFISQDGQTRYVRARSISVFNSMIYCCCSFVVVVQQPHPNDSKLLSNSAKNAVTDIVYSFGFTVLADSRQTYWRQNSLCIFGC